MTSNTTLTTVTWRYETTEADAARVRRLVESTGVFNDSEIDVAEELVVERCNKGARSGYCFVFAESAEEMIGYACYGPIACTSGSFDLFWIAVDPRRQRHGLGRQLMLEAERMMRLQGARHIYIETSSRPHYAPTRRFYGRCGYAQIALFPDFYAPGDDKVVFVKRISPPEGMAVE